MAVMADPRHDLGRRAEAAVAGWLAAAGWRIVATRTRGPGGGEVDLVAIDPDAVLVGVEIRARRSFRAGTGAETIDHAKVRRMHRSLVAAGRVDGATYRALRLDFVAVTPASGAPGRWCLRRTPGIEG